MKHLFRISRLRTAAAVAFTGAVVLIALILTVGGLGAFVEQVAAADGIRAALVTIVLNLGLVLVGPVLLVAYINLMPRSRLPRMLESARIGAFAQRSQAEPRQR